VTRPWRGLSESWPRLSSGSGEPIVAPAGYADAGGPIRAGRGCVASVHQRKKNNLMLEREEKRSPSKLQCVIYPFIFFLRRDGCKLVFRQSLLTDLPPNTSPHASSPSCASLHARASCQPAMAACGQTHLSFCYCVPPRHTWLAGPKHSRPRLLNAAVEAEIQRRSSLWAVAAGARMACISSRSRSRPCTRQAGGGDIRSRPPQTAPRARRWTRLWSPAGDGTSARPHYCSATGILLIQRRLPPACPAWSALQPVFLVAGLLAGC
jgi:hypothetical protein